GKYEESLPRYENLTKRYVGKREALYAFWSMDRSCRSMAEKEPGKGRAEGLLVARAWREMLNKMTPGDVAFKPPPGDVWNGDEWERRLKLLEAWATAAPDKTGGR